MVGENNNPLLRKNNNAIFTDIGVNNARSESVTIVCSGGGGGPGSLANDKTMQKIMSQTLGQ